MDDVIQFVTRFREVIDSALEEGVFDNDIVKPFYSIKGEGSGSTVYFDFNS